MRRGEVPSGRTIGQAVSDAYARETQIEVDRMKSALAALQKPDPRKRRPRMPDPRHVFIATMKARGLDRAATCRALDAAVDAGRRELQAREFWIRRSGGLRLWIELWRCKRRLDPPRPAGGFRAALRAHRAANQSTGGPIG